MRQLMIPYKKKVTYLIRFLHQNQLWPAPELEKLDGIPELNILNTSPIEIGRFLRNIKKSKASYCGIPGMFINLISQPISYSMAKLFNNVLILLIFLICGKLHT